MASLRMLADIAASMQRVTARMEPWSLSDLTLGLYLLSMKHAAEGVHDVIQGDPVTDRHTVEALLYHLELARGAYAKDAAGLARVSMLRECRVVKFEAKVRPDEGAGCHVPDMWGEAGTYSEGLV